MAREVTEKQRAAIEAMEAARRQGCPLSQYAQAHGLNAPRIYALLSALRKQGVLPKSQRRKPSRFVAVRLRGPATSVSAAERPSTVVCRLITVSGCVLECMQWPAASWFNSLSEGPADAAT